MPTEKIKKGIFLPKWVSDILDQEGELYDGTSVVCSAMVFYFSQCTKEQKAQIMQQYRLREVMEAYDLKNISPEVQARMDSLVAGAAASGEAIRRGRKVSPKPRPGSRGGAKGTV